MAHLTGTAAVNFSESEIAALHNYIETGGVLFVEACGGSSAFSDSTERELAPKLFPDTPLQAISSDHPVLKGTYIGMQDITTPHLRSATAQKIGPGQRLKFLTHGKGILIFSPLDISSALVNVQSPGVTGYESLYAEDLTKNIVLWAAARGKTE